MKEAWNDYKRYCEVAKEFRHKHKIATIVVNFVVIAALLVYYYLGVVVGKMSA